MNELCHTVSELLQQYAEIYIVLGIIITVMSVVVFVVACVIVIRIFMSIQNEFKKDGNHNEG